MNKTHGYTIIELLLTMVIASILLAVGVPRLSVFFEGNRMVANTNNLVSAIQIARSEAIKRGQRVTVCWSANSTAAAPGCDSSGSGTWEEGWVVFTDGGTVGTFDNGTDTVLRRQDAAEGSETTIRTSSASVVNYISFTSRGVPKDGNGDRQSGTFRVCDGRGLKNASGNVVARGVVMNAAGRVRLSKDDSVIGSCP